MTVIAVRFITGALFKRAYPLASGIGVTERNILVGSLRKRDCRKLQMLDLPISGLFGF
jgi:hypothetical protein